MNLYIRIYIYIYTYVVHVYIYIYIYTSIQKGGSPGFPGFMEHTTICLMSLHMTALPFALSHLVHAPCFFCPTTVAKH